MISIHQPDVVFDEAEQQLQQKEPKVKQDENIMEPAVAEDQPTAQDVETKAIEEKLKEKKKSKLILPFDEYKKI